jgi:predicted HD superfamily hydrolase involved in NAD metabolism
MLPDFFHDLQTNQPVTEAVRRFLSTPERQKKLRHINGVAAQGQALARRFGVSLATTETACMAHDLAAVVPRSELVSVAASLGVELSAADLEVPQIIHGPIAAAVLRQRLGITDEDVLNAVRYHSTLRAGASDLECIVFAADKLSFDPTTPNTGFHAAMWAVRETAPLRQLCWLYLDWVVRHGPGLGWRLHPNLMMAHEELTGS